MNKIPWKSIFFVFAVCLCILVPALVSVYQIAPRFVKGFLVILVTEIVYFVFLKCFGNLNKKGDVMEKDAVQNGRIVKAVKVGKTQVRQRNKTTSLSPSDPRWNNYDEVYYEYTATYEYMVNGRTYQYKGTVQDKLPADEITLFYPENKPAQAFSSGDVQEMYGFSWYFKVYMVPLMIVLAVIGWNVVSEIIRMLSVKHI